MQLLLMVLFSALLQYFLPWWSAALVPFALAFWQGRNAGGSFWNGFGAGSSLWLAVAYWQHVRSGGLLTGRIAELLSVSTPLLFTITGLLGGLVAGLAALSGFYLRQVLGQARLKRRAFTAAR